jgi:DNA polymerase-1
LSNQIKRVEEVVKALNIPIFAISGFEADDVIGSLASQATSKSKVKSQKLKVNEVVIVTGDKDIMQLIDRRVKVYAPRRGTAEGEIYDRQKVKRILGVWPEQIIDYKALTGDASDNYPGISGIGPKTAVQLLQRYHNLKNIFKNLSKIKPMIAEKIRAGRESAFLSQKLATIVTKVPLKLDRRACLVHDYDQEKAIKLFEELEFKSLIDKLPGYKAQKVNRKTDQQIKLF